MHYILLSILVQLYYWCTSKHKQDSLIRALAYWHLFLSIRLNKVSVGILYSLPAEYKSVQMH